MLHWELLWCCRCCRCCRCCNNWQQHKATTQNIFIRLGFIVQMFSQDLQTWVKNVVDKSGKLIISAWHWLTFSIAPYLPHVDISHSGSLFSRKRWIKIFDISGSYGRSQGSHQSQVSTSSVRNQGGESCRGCSRVQIYVYIPHSVSSSGKGNKEITKITCCNCTFCTCTF